MNTINLSCYILILLISVTPLEASITADLDIIHQRIIDELMQSEVDDSNIESLIAAIKDDGNWPEINYEDLSLTGYENRIHVSNLLELSKAFRKPSSSYFENPDLIKVFSSGIDFWIEHDFIAANWHTNEIANPRNWTAILMLMENELSKEQTLALVDMAGRANFNSWGARPGGDQIKIAGIAAELAVFQNEEQTLKKAVEIMANEVQVSSGNGIKPDLSFHHRVDRVTSILSYGTGYVGAFADWAVRLAGTKYSFPERTTKLVIDFYLDGICKSMIYGWYKDPGSMNRGISRKGALTAVSSEIPEKLSEASDYRKDELENIVKIRQGEQKPNLVSNRFFWHSEYQSHQRPNYFASVRMFSERNHNMEYPHNMESLKMHHFADGSNFVSRTGKEYYDIFPVWDWQKIPGTTVVQKPSLPSYQEIVKWGETDFVGAVTDGIYGAATFDFDSPHDDLKARKSWFFFDEEYVCLGVGIQSGADNPVVTTINQCLLNSNVMAKSKNKISKITKGEHVLKDVSWVFHDSIAYIFPKPATISLNNKSYRGKWQDIAKQAWAVDEQEVQQELFSLWIEHGRGPTNESYEYLVKPAISVDDIEKYVNSTKIRTQVNNSKIKAVRHQDLKLTQIVFYEPGSLEVSNGVTISVNQPGLVMVETSGEAIKKITVADPTRKLTSFHLIITPQFNGKSEIDVQLPQDGNAGKSVVLNVNEKGFSPPLFNNSVSNAEIKFEEPKNNGEHYIGEKYGGGIIIWLDETRNHGLIAATNDQNPNIQWKNGKAKTTEHFSDRGDRVTNARGDGIGAGKMNTILIVSQQTEDRFSGNFAAKVCVECESGGYGDWYLPSKTELGMMYEFRKEIGGFDSNLYWSSTEYNVGFVWGQSFKHYKSEYTFNKGSSCAVRCVRKF